ncbi:MAG: hypothetical protein ACJAV5_002261, partial [Vicingaceae bacterium]
MKKLLTLFALASFLTFGVSNSAIAQEEVEETATEMVDSAAIAAEKAAEDAAAVAEKEAMDAEKAA